MTDEFRSWTVDGAEGTFDALLASARFEELGRGRRGAVLVQVDDDGAVPLVRTTTAYRAPAQLFGELHRRLADEIRSAGELANAFNNALLEHYTGAYATMKRHSDQALDLAAGSAIALASWYRDPARPSRRLVVTPKAPSEASFDLVLAHGSVVTFSLDTNRRFTHTIALDRGAADNDWLGLTFRTSRTFVRFVDGTPRLASGEPLTLATEDERLDFFRMRRRENDEPDVAYPAITYTISASDLLPPVAGHALG